MSTVNFKLAELRKKWGLTQQELGDILSVSFQTISKWENGVTLPDITMLPVLSDFFQVSVDALLGLVPLGDEYHPTNSDQSEYWKKRGRLLPPAELHHSASEGTGRRCGIDAVYRRYDFLRVEGFGQVGCNIGFGPPPRKGWEKSQNLQ